MNTKFCESEPEPEFNSVLYREVGQFGKYQLVTIILLAFPSLICAFMAGDYIFTAASLPTRCAVPECDGPEPEYLPEWIYNVIPTTASGFDNCNRFVSATNSGVLPGDLCPATLFDRDTIVPCDSYVHGRTNTAVYDFNIECQEWLRALPGTLNSAGGMIALVLAGFISDRFGRRMSIIFFSFNIALIGIVRAFSVNFAMYTALQFLQTAIGGGAFSAAYILAAEIVGPKYRVRTSATISSMFALGQAILGLLAFAIPAWRVLTLVLYVPVFLIISYHWILSESFRWLLSKNKQNEGKSTIEYAARLSNRTQDLMLSSRPYDHNEAGSINDRRLLNTIIMKLPRRMVKEPQISSRKCLYINRELDSDTDVEYCPSEEDEELNIHQQLLNKPVREQITWATRYLQPEKEEEKSLVKKADDLTDRIANEFCEYMKQLGGDQQSKLFTPKAIKELFQIEFDTHVAQSLRVVPKELPCVEEKIAIATGNHDASRYATLEREITKDIRAEQCPLKVTAFGKSLPMQDQYHGPSNNTKKLWRSARHVPKELVTLKTVWEGITNLRSVKEYCRWMIDHPEHRRPPYLSSLGLFDPAVLDARLTFEAEFQIDPPVGSPPDIPAPIENIRKRLSDIVHPE